MPTLFTFLNPQPIPVGRRRMLFPDHSIRVVEEIPDWYWPLQDRIVGRSEAGLLQDAVLFTYFTGELEDDGTLFHTVYSLPPYRRWGVVFRAKTLEEARQGHVHVRHKWWAGDPAASRIGIDATLPPPLALMDVPAKPPRL